MLARDWRAVNPSRRRLGRAVRGDDLGGIMAANDQYEMGILEKKDSIVV